MIGTPVWNEKDLVHVNGGGGAQYAIRIGLRITPLGEDGEPDSEGARFVVYEPNATNYVNYNGEFVSEYIPTPGIDKNRDTLIPEDHLIRQTSTLWTEADPVEKDVVVYKHGTFMDDVELFDLEQDQKVKIDMYLWLEGQDVDCTNRIGDAARIFSSIQFYVDIHNQGGMEEIK